MENKIFLITGGTTPMLAEVADKEPALLLIWSLAAFFSAACFLLCRWRPWAVIVALPLAAFWIYATVTWLRDPNEGPAIVHELGRGYVTQAWIAAFVPLLCGAMGYRRGRAGHDAA